MIATLIVIAVLSTSSFEEPLILDFSFVTAGFQNEKAFGKVKLLLVICMQKLCIYNSFVSWFRLLVLDHFVLFVKNIID